MLAGIILLQNLYYAIPVPTVDIKPYNPFRAPLPFLYLIISARQLKISEHKNWGVLPDLNK